MLDLSLSIPAMAALGGTATPFDMAEFMPQDSSAAYFDLNPASGLVYQDHFGTVPVTAANDPVGLVVPVDNRATGSDLYTGTAPSIGSGWAWNSGTRTGTATAASGTLRLPHVNADTFRYVVDITVTVTSGTLTVYIGAAGASYRKDITASGTYRLHLFSGGSVDVGTYFLGTSFTGSFVLNSIKDENPFCRSQMTAGSRGTYKVDANGFHYIDLTGGKTLDNGGIVSSSQRASLAFPAYIAMILARTGAASQSMISSSGGTATFGFTNTASVNSISTATSKSSTSHVVGTRTGAAPIGLPVPADLYITAGQTSGYVAGGNRSIPDDGTLNAAEQRTISNNLLGSDTTNALNLIMTECHWYGGLVRMGASVTEAERQGVADWMNAKVGRNLLNPQDIFVIAGQSNAMGVGNYATAPAVPLGDGVEYLDDSQLKPFKEPMQHSGAGQAALTGSAWGAFCNQWKTETGRVAAIVGSAWSGEGLINGSITDGKWLSGELLTDNLASKLAAARADMPAATFRGVIYMGGENDSTLSFTQSEYKTHLLNFLTKLRTKTGISDLKLLICSLDDTTGSPAIYATMRAAMVDAANESDGIELIVPFQNYVIGQGLSSDGIHLNQTALNDMGVRAAIGAATVWGL